MIQFPRTRRRNVAVLAKARQLRRIAPRVCVSRTAGGHLLPGRETFEFHRMPLQPVGVPRRKSAAPRDGDILHIHIPHDLRRNPFPGCCPYHCRRAIRHPIREELARLLDGYLRNGDLVPPNWEQKPACSAR